ncbi:MAG: hypothetical protein O3B37_09300 [Proteobacteria bacterium]|nr:hypothetical protein [Pseudomonadota bacterium]
MNGRSSHWHSWLSRGVFLILVPVFIVVVAGGYFFSLGAQQRHGIAMPPPGLPDVAGDQNGRLGAFFIDGRLDAARVETRFEDIRGRFDGMRVIFVPSYLSDAVLPTVNLGVDLGYMAGIYNWLAAEGIDAEIADIETEDSVAANAERLVRIVGDGTSPICFVTHSKGGLDVMEYLRRATPDQRKRVACWIAMQAPFAGSPVADLARDVSGFPDLMDAVLSVLGGRGESLTDLTIETRGAYLKEHRREIAAVLETVPMLCVATYVADPGNFTRPTSWSYPTLVWMHDNGVPNDGLVPVRSPVEICPRSVTLEGLDHTGIVSPGLVAPIDQTALMRLLFHIALD